MCWGVRMMKASQRLEFMSAIGLMAARPPDGRARTLSERLAGWSAADAIRRQGGLAEIDRTTFELATFHLVQDLAAWFARTGRAVYLASDGCQYGIEAGEITRECRAAPVQRRLLP